MLSVTLSLLVGSGNVYPAKPLVETTETSISEEKLKLVKQN